jgi:hypothetical protein
MERKGFIGGSDAKRLLDGEWLPLWEEKTGRRKPEDLSHRFEVQLGISTERFHIDWLNKYHGFDVYCDRTRCSRSHAQHSWMQASLDGWCEVNDSFVEVKHSNGRANRDSMVDWYQPQIAHYCNVVGKPSGWLSYIAGNSAPDYFKLEPSPAYLKALLEVEQAFWWHVETDTAPDKIGIEADELIAGVMVAAGEAKVDEMRVVDMTGNNEWATHAFDYLAWKDSAAMFEKAKASLKKLVEADVRIAAGCGIMIKRNKAGNLMISEGGS